MANGNVRCLAVALGLLGLAGCGDGESVEEIRPYELGHVSDTEEPAHHAADTRGTSDSGGMDAAELGDQGAEPGDPGAEARALLQGVDESGRRALSGLKGEVHVLRTEAGVPHIYAEDREDLARVYGFVTAMDRYFMLDLARRVGSGRLSELLGDAALPNDMEARGLAMSYVGERIHEHLTDEQGLWLDAFAAGINAYIDGVKSGDLAPPSELELAGPLLGAEAPGDLMAPFGRRDIASMVATVIYESSFETGDVGRAHALALMETHYEGVAMQSLRRQGAWQDIYGDVRPIKAVSSAPGFVLDSVNSAMVMGAAGAGPRQSASRAAQPPPALLESLASTLDGFQKRLLRDHDVGFGSNAWAVSSTHGADNSAILAGDGHLPLSVPSILYQVGLDTSVFGGGDVHQLGLTIPGLPMMPIGTNGKVAWSQTQFGGDITDWYAEEIQLDTEGIPVMSRVGEQWQALTRVDETFVVADVPILGSVGRTLTSARWVTTDGRWITAIEGRPASDEEVAAEAAGLIYLLGEPWLCGDQDDDGVISAVSFDYVGLDMRDILSAVDALGLAEDVAEFRDACRGLTAYSQNLVAIDSAGSVFYTGYQPLPCRGYLEREVDGAWKAGADPNALLDGARYPGFDLSGLGQDEAGSLGPPRPEECAVPFEKWPQVSDPEEGYVLTANNDPGGLSFDGELFNDAYYLGGPWDLGFRADVIQGELERLAVAGDVTVEDMAELQGEHSSALGLHFVSYLLAALERAKVVDPVAGEIEAELSGLYQSRETAMEEVHQRLGAWLASGCPAKSGVDTFYQSVGEEERAHAVATMVFNAWFPRVIKGVFDDEGLPGIWQGSGGKVRALSRMLEGRGPDNPGDLASWNLETGESVFFDTLGTDAVETSDLVIVKALDEALLFLEGPGQGPGAGGFATADMSAWLWGLRHQVRFESLLADFLGDDPTYALLTDGFAISTDTLPLAQSMEPGDPRAALRWFPRDGDQYAVDASNPGFSGKRFTYGSGAVMRMVIALNQEGVSGQNIIPGGQSGLTDSPHFSDQAELWLANEALPLRFHPSDVASAALSRVVFEPTLE